MDMAVEYRRAFGPILPGMTWHEVLAHVRRVRALELRDRLIVADGSVIGQLASSDDGLAQQLKAKYERLAFPEIR